jgi:hypothetical protein
MVMPERNRDTTSSGDICLFAIAVFGRLTPAG